VYGFFLVSEFEVETAATGSVLFYLRSPSENTKGTDRRNLIAYACIENL
jgi:hypothetical protein